MDKFLLPREWISFAEVSPREFVERDHKKEVVKEDDNGFGGKLMVVASSKGRMTYLKDSDVACGPFTLTIFSKVYGQEDERNGIRIVLEGHNFMGKQHGEAFQKTFVIIDGFSIESPSGAYN
ncbi:hypothetical protein ISTM_236 [Insectomime virus]|uniref:Uncharacterized protein n=1 Tax=Tunisvirus fontaine2 TaxID=1421067 RepID=V9SDK3_9VIRU|nr:hypothetical protein D1R32_gp078 [Tunisvirus fontaine2]AHA46134.1 hypothetical protein ISTM_236 [Insectomime virus]AHC54795.1 hypothetical protein TNS_ORF77 [Tunisvirus fontaine2]